MAGMIAALFVDPRGIYSTLPDVDTWGEERDARLYDGPHPVVAHPPCARWSVLAGLVEHVYGYKRGEDDGCFASALASVRRFGGVLEHPASSSAWAHFGLPRPPSSGGWVRGLCGGWSCHVEQCHFGHRARKATWLYAFGCDLPVLPWGPGEATAWVSDCVNHSRGKVVERMSKRERLHTPAGFADVLVRMARSVTPSSKG